jgi:hypothetical protein
MSSATTTRSPNPLDWTFTRQDLADLLVRLDERERDPPLAIAA